MTPATPGSADEGCPDLAGSRHELKDIGRDARLVQEPHSLGRNQRRLLGRLRQDGVAGRERRRNLAREDREREVPRGRCRARAQAPGAAPIRAPSTASAA
jgi:hypothetical protein